MKEIEIEGKTVQEAIKKGLKEIGLSKDDVDVKILSEGKTGLFGLMGASPAKIKITPKDAAKKTDKPIKDGEKPLKETLLQTCSNVKDELKNILKLMGITSEVDTKVEGEYVHADINTSDSALLIGKKGQTLGALELITNMIMNRRSKDFRVRTLVDTAGYRARRTKTLEHLAEQTALEVKKTGEAIQLEPMSASERRIIHMMLKDNPDIQTNSDGQGAFRKVVLSPANPEKPDEA